MKRRFVYALLFGLPGLFIAGIIAVFLFGASMGFLWLFVFGDNPWPDVTVSILPILIVLTFLLLWVGLIVVGYRMGRRLESEPTLNRNHVLVSLGLTILFILFIVFQQWSVGNIGPKSDSLLCSDYCVQKGYAGSGTPPQDSGDRTCSCYDSAGSEAIKISIEDIESEISK